MGFMNDEPNDATPFLPEKRSLKALREASAGCRGCHLWQGATQTVFGEGRKAARLMLVGEQPGDREDRAGKPFVGPAGHLLDRALDEAGIEPSSVYRTNVVKHFRFSGTRGKQRIHKSPGRVHVAACAPWLLTELDVVRPRGVVLLGGVAGKAVYGPSYKVGESRGTLVDWPDVVGGRPVLGHRPEWVVPTTHPAAVLRSRRRDEDFVALVSDLAIAHEQLR
jgi:uracil-DNA glycosylase